MLWNAFLWKYRHLSALHISNTRECYDWVTLWWDTWEFKLGQKPAFREVINCELFTCFDKCSPQVQTWLKRRTSLATLYHDQNAGSPWLRPILPPPPALRPGLPFWIVKTWPKLTSLHFFFWKKRLHRVLTRISEHIWMYNRFCLEYIYVQKSLRLFMTSFFFYSFSSSSALSWLWLSWFCWDTEQWTETLVSFIVG